MQRTPYALALKQLRCLALRAPARSKHPFDHHYRFFSGTRLALKISTDRFLPTVAPLAKESLHPVPRYKVKRGTERLPKDQMGVDGGADM
jgi:hypothetical protein